MFEMANDCANSNRASKPDRARISGSGDEAKIGSEVGDCVEPQACLEPPARKSSKITGIKSPCSGSGCEAALRFVPRGFNRIEAAWYVGVSPGTFDRLVQEGSMPQPKQIRARRVWDRVEVDAAFTALDRAAEHDEEPNDFDHVLR